MYTYTYIYLFLSIFHSSIFHKYISEEIGWPCRRVDGSPALPPRQVITLNPLNPEPKGN